jgi:death-on-curing protein
MAERVYLTIAEVVAVHHHQIEEYGGEHGMLNQAALEAAVFRPQNGYYNDLSEEADALFESLVNNHPFLDGSNRAAFASVHTFLLVNGFDLNVTSAAAFDFMIKTMTAGKFRFAVVHEWIATHLVPLER